MKINNNNNNRYKSLNLASIQKCNKHIYFSSEKKRRKSHRKKSPVDNSHRRKWLNSSTHNADNYKDKVVFVSYNILGVQNAQNHLDLYRNVPNKYIEWRYRRKVLCDEITRFDADILCLQEVDRFYDLENLLQNKGYEGVYQARTGDEACDGCAIFWKNELFTLLHEEKIEFQRFGLRNNVAQLCVLKRKQNQSDPDQDETSELLSSQTLLVGNIHVLFNNKRGDMKLGQVRIFVEKAHELSEIWGNIPVILGGDFNSTPKSAIYEFLASSELDLQLHDRRNMSETRGPQDYGAFQSQNTRAYGSWGSVRRPDPCIWEKEELRLATGNDKLTFLRHSLNLSSAYLGVRGNCTTRNNCGEPLATSYHSMFMGTVDYIWHSPDLVPVRVLDTLPLDILSKTGGLPSKEFGSDHLALVCELAFMDIDKGT